MTARVRTDIDPTELGHRAFYKILTSTVVPRPIAWVSTVSADGVVNLAPHSFFTVSCVDPPMVQFTSVGTKASLRNVRATGEFVVCLAPEPLFEQINATGTDFPGRRRRVRRRRTHPGAERDGDATAGGRVTGGAGVRAAPGSGAGRLDGGDRAVRHAAIHTAVIDGDVTGGGLPRIEALRPLARLGGNLWSTLGDVREITRIRHTDWPGHYSPTARPSASP